MSRNRRKPLAWLCLSALLFLQLAVAAYACPMLVNEGGASVHADAAMPSCPGMDDQVSKLCEQHCVVDAQSVDTQPHSTVNAPVVPLMTVQAPSDLRLSSSGRAIRDASFPTAFDPPPLVRFGVLRI